MRANRLQAVILFFCMAMAGKLLAHGMDLQVSGEGDLITGQVRYSDGSLAAGEYIAIDNLDDTSELTQSTLTNEEGRFTYLGIIGSRYRITAHGEEGHSTSVDFTLGDLAPVASRWPPIYLILVALLLLSILPAVYFRRTAQFER